MSRRVSGREGEGLAARVPDPPAGVAAPSRPDAWVVPLERLRRRRERSGELYLEFLRRPALSAGLYELAVGSDDPQAPHHEDEVYIVMGGRAQLRVGNHDHPVEPGTVAFVPREVPHRFHSIVVPLSVAVVFGPAETLDPTPRTAPRPDRAPEHPRKVPRRFSRTSPTRAAPKDVPAVRASYDTDQTLGG